MKALSRRRAIQTLFCSSAAMALNLHPRGAQAKVAAGGLNFLAIGDFGSGSTDQKKIAKAMQDYAAKLSLKPDALFFVGDNFYGPAHPMPKVNGKTVKGESAPFTTASKRWKTDIEDMYPASAFACPQYAILGNHDYHDNKGGEKTQLAYAKKEGVRWQMPNKWYRQDFGGDTPVLTVLFVDTNLREVSGRDTKTKKYTKACMAPDEEKAQHEWLKAELAKPRAPFTLVVGHHPLYSNGDHGDTKPLIAAWDNLFQEQKVHAYLCGHDHDLQHLELEGKFTSHILSGGGGAKIRKLKTPKRKMPYGLAANGFTHISVQADALTFAHFGADGGLLHEFTKRLDGKVELKA